jgi:hypothetical protein
MGVAVCGCATMQCSFGLAPSTLMIMPTNKVMTTMPYATIMDNIPFVNILPFGMCNSIANPAVASATAAALGVLTPMPCTPVIPAPWAPGCPTVLVANMPALNNSSKLMCAYGGVIQLLGPGQFKTMIP